MGHEVPPRLVTALKHVFDDFDLRSVSATYNTGPSTWTKVTVRENGICESTPDGLTVEQEDGGL